MTAMQRRAVLLGMLGVGSCVERAPAMRGVADTWQTRPKDAELTCPGKDRPPASGKSLNPGVAAIEPAELLGALYTRHAGWKRGKVWQQHERNAAPGSDRASSVNAEYERGGGERLQARVFVQDAIRRCTTEPGTGLAELTFMLEHSSARNAKQLSFAQRPALYVEWSFGMRELTFWSGDRCRVSIQTVSAPDTISLEGLRELAKVVNVTELDAICSQRSK